MESGGFGDSNLGAVSGLTNMISLSNREVYLSKGSFTQVPRHIVCGETHFSHIKSNSTVLRVAGTLKT